MTSDYRLSQALKAKPLAAGISCTAAAAVVMATDTKTVELTQSWVP